MTRRRPARLPERQRQLREEAIVEAAQERLARSGYLALNMDELAGALGVSKATLYLHYPSKDALVLEVLVRAIEASEAFFDTLPAGLPALTRIEQSLRHNLARRSASAVIGSGALPHEVTSHPRFRARQARLWKKVGRLVDQARAEGSLKKGLSTPVVVRLFARLFSLDVADLVSRGLCSPQEVTETLVTIALTGVRSESA